LEDRRNVGETNCKSGDGADQRVLDVHDDDDHETWSLPLKEERRLRLFENRLLRRIFGPKRDGVTEEWRKLHNEELNDLYCAPNIVQVTKSKIMR
jgi:hypothetical protein